MQGLYVVSYHKIVQTGQFELSATSSEGNIAYHGLRHDWGRTSAAHWNCVQLHAQLYPSEPSLQGAPQTGPGPKCHEGVCVASSYTVPDR